MKKNILNRYLILTLGSTILAFGLYNIHAQADVTEGGILGLELLFEYWFGISPSVTSIVLGAVCYGVSFAVLGVRFLGDSIVAAAAYSAAYFLFERFPPVWRDIADYPLLAAILGAVFVGVGVGICVRIGGAPSGDDALAMALSKLTRLPIGTVYLIGDLLVLALSLTYLPLTRILYSLLTVFLSGQIINLFQKHTEKAKNTQTG